MICPDCLENEKDAVEMVEEELIYDTYDHRGNHKQLVTGYYWVCPNCWCEVDTDDEYSDSFSGFGSRTPGSEDEPGLAETQERNAIPSG